MDPRALVRPLEDRWQDVLDAALSRWGLATREVGRLAPMVERLSAAYNAGAAEGRRTKLPLEARVAFSFPRDVPKGAAAVRELVASGALTVPARRPLRVVDLGAGLGAMTWGLVRALEASGARGAVEAVFVDEDDEVLGEAVEMGRLWRTLMGGGPVDLDISVCVDSLASTGRRAAERSADLVFLGQVLSELDVRAAPEARVESHSSLVLHVLDTMVAADGSLVIVEPALRDRTRHLHAVRDRVLEKGSPSGNGEPGAVTVFAPCLHAANCPALGIEGEWCHEDLPVDLPSWVTPIARAAGLRWQGLTFSYLVLRKDGRVPAPRLSSDAVTAVRFRAVSDLLRSKGKTELLACAEDGRRARIRRLERDERTERGIPFSSVRRGDVVTLRSGPAPLHGAKREGDQPERPIDERGRIRPGTHAAIDVGVVRK